MPTERGVPIAAGERRGLRICSAAGDMDWRARWPAELLTDLLPGKSGWPKNLAFSQSLQHCAGTNRAGATRFGFSMQHSVCHFRHCHKEF